MLKYIKIFQTLFEIKLLVLIKQMIDEKRNLIEKLIATIDKYPGIVFTIILTIITLGFPTIGMIWGLTAEVQVLSISLYKQIFIDNYGLFIVPSIISFLCSIFYTKSRMNFKKEIHRIAEEKRFLQEALLNMELPRSENREA